MSNLDNKIPGNWKKITLGELINVKHGYAFKGDFISEIPNNNILVTPGNFNLGGGFKRGKLKYYHGKIPDGYILKPDDVIVTMTDLSKEADTLGFSAKVPKDNDNFYLHNQRIGLVKFKNNNFDKQYAYWLLRTKHYQRSMVNSSTGSTVSHTSPSRIHEYIFNLPPLSEQKAIAKVPNTFDEKIENLQAQNITLEKTVQTLFKEWFGKHQVNDTLPKGWRVESLEEIAIHIKNTIKPFDNPDKQYLHYSLPAYDDGLKPVIENGIEIKSNKYILVNNSFLVSKLNPFTPRIWTIFKSGENHICSTEFQVVKPKSKKYFSLIHCFLNSKGFTSELSQKVKGTSSSHQRVNPQDIFDVKLIIPEDEKLIKFNQIVDIMILKKNINQNQIQTLTKTRDALLPKLMSGVVRVQGFTS